MADQENRMIIDTKVGNVINRDSKDIIVLKGEYQEPGGYADRLQIIITPEDEYSLKIIKDIPYGGYFLKLFIGDFNNDGISEIMLRGGYGGIGGFEIASIYQLKDIDLIEIFSSDLFSTKYKFQGTYLQNKNVEIISLGTKHSFTIDISKKPKDYLNYIYDKNGAINPNVSISVFSINSANPINKVFDKHYSLAIYQRIVGSSSPDTIGVLESVVDLINNNINIRFMGLLLISEEKIRLESIGNIIQYRNKIHDKLYGLPQQAIKVPLDFACNKDGIIYFDIDFDGNDEEIIPYVLDGTPYISVYKKERNKFKLIDTYKGQGNSISDIKIKKIGRYCYMFIAWVIKEKVNKLEILSCKNCNLTLGYKIKMPYNYKFYIEDTDDELTKILKLWTYDNDYKYNVTLYKINDKSIEKIKEYYYNIPK